jgi:hypothetical protein
VDSPPRHCDRVHARGLRRANVEGRVADVCGLKRIGVHPARREEQWLRIGLVSLGLVASDDRLEQVPERDPRERELDGGATLRRYDAEPPALLVQAYEHVLHAGARLQLAVERLVVRAVDVHELVDPIGSEDLHLRLEPRASDRLHQLRVLILAAEHLAGSVTHRGEDDRARVDDSAVEIEEDDREAHHCTHRIDAPREPQLRFGAVPAVSDFRYLVVPHTHWDREWYLPFEQFRLRLGEVVDGVLDVLERDNSFPSFTLDGQAIVLEDYLDVRPEHEARLRALLSAGRLEAGPWYVLPDELLVGGESLVRNLLLGRRVCRRYGVEPSPAGYEPDSFGHTSQLPQVLAGFGVRTFLFSRGLGDELDDVGVVFRWRAGPAEVVACQQLPHYDNFAQLESAEDAEARVVRMVDRFGELLERAGCDTILLANGSDHLPVQPELPKLCAELERRCGSAFRIGRLADFAPAPAGLPAYVGELVGSRLQNILRGVNSARIYLKQLNEAAERRLLAAETITALRALRGAHFRAADLRLAWRDLLRNHPHDSICGCSCDEVHRDMQVRYEQLDRTLDALEPPGTAFVNPLPYRRARLVQVDGREGVVDVAGFAGRPVDLEPMEKAGGTDTTAISNGVLLVQAEADGTLTVTDLRDGRRFPGLHGIEDEPDVGDLYTFCPGGPVTPAQPTAARVLLDGPLVSELVVETELAGVHVRTIVRLVRGIERIELRTTVENAAEDHRLRARFPIVTDAREVRAESQFAVVRRPLASPSPRAPWVEPPVPTAHTLGAVALGPLALLTKGLPEYEAGTDRVVRLTLLRCVGTIARPPGLPTRPSGAGPPVPTPDGQCLGVHSFEYALRFDADRLSDAGLVRAAQDYRTDFVRGEPLEPPFELDGDVVFSCLKGAEDGDGIVLRVFNPNATPERIGVRGIDVARVRLDEEAGADGGLELAPGEIATFRLYP